MSEAKEVGQSVLERWKGKTPSIEAQLGGFVTRVTPWWISTMSVSLGILVSLMDKAYCRAVSAILKRCRKSRILFTKLWDFRIFVRDFQLYPKDHIFDKDIILSCLFFPSGIVTGLLVSSHFERFDCFFFFFL